MAQVLRGQQCKQPLQGPLFAFVEMQKIELGKADPTISKWWLPPSTAHYLEHRCCHPSGRRQRTLPSCRATREGSASGKLIATCQPPGQERLGTPVLLMLPSKHGFPTKDANGPSLNSLSCHQWEHYGASDLPSSASLRTPLNTIQTLCPHHGYLCVPMLSLA
jgi:hypothetical protein